MCFKDITPITYTKSLYISKLLYIFLKERISQNYAYFKITRTSFYHILHILLLYHHVIKILIKSWKNYISLCV